MSEFRDMMTAVRKPLRLTLVLAALCAAGVSAAAVCLLGLSGWFLGASAIAGATTASAIAFNYLLPAAAIRGLAIARTVLRYFERYLGHAAALRALAQLRPRLFARIAASEPQAVLGLSRGEASSRLVQDVTTLETAIVAESAPASAIGGIAVALALNAVLGMGAVLTCAAGLVIAGAGGLLLRQRKAEPPHLGEVKAAFFDVLPFLPDISAYALNDRMLERFRQAEARLLSAQNGQAVFEALAKGIGLIVAALTAGLIVVTHLHAAMPVLALSLLATTLGFESLGPLLRSLAQKPLFAAAEERLAQLTELAAAPARITSEEARLGDFSLDRHTRLLIDGPSGCGKTRLIETLVGLRPAQEDIPSAPGLFALAPQDATVLNGTIRDNLRMAGNVSETRMLAALDVAQLTPRVARMKAGLDTWLGEGGITLSGGERKRLGIARALLRDAPILLLDEPSEGLDQATEAALVTALAAHLEASGQGLILVSHKQAPRRLCRDVLRI